MKSGFAEDSFFTYLMNTPWYPEVVDLYFRGRYKAVYEDIIAELTGKQLVQRRQDRLICTLKA
ncbi:MAG: hypothetical protein AB1523_10155 [Bacillota bacterium]